MQDQRGAGVRVGLGHTVETPLQMATALRFWEEELGREAEPCRVSTASERKPAPPRPRRLGTGGSGYRSWERARRRPVNKTFH